MKGENPSRNLRMAEAMRLDRLRARPRRNVRRGLVELKPSVHKTRVRGQVIPTSLRLARRDEGAGG